MNQDIGKNLPDCQAWKTARILEEIMGSPENVDRHTRHKSANGGPQTPERDDDDHHVACPAEVDLRKDAEVLQQDRELREAKRSIVEPDRCPEPDCDDLVFGARELPDVLAHAELSLLVGRDAEGDREDSGDEDQGIVGAWLFRNEETCAETRQDCQTCDDGEDDRHHVECRL